MSEPTAAPLPDITAREEALDPARSFLVQAPAGSGKTELLTMRFLALLAEVEEPEQVLAITFTKAATAEMRYRILKKLDAASSAKSAGEDAALPLARAARANALRRGWRLLEQPQRLNIQTIDSLCLRIAQRMPLRARLGGTLQPTEKAKPLYRKAARHTFDRLGGADAELNTALAELLTLRDSNLKDCETLLAEMLGHRDQWLQAFPLSGGIDWQQVRSRMEAPFRREVERVLSGAHALLSSHPAMVSELIELANYACDSVGVKLDIKRLAGSTALPPPSPEFVGHWHCLCELLLTKGNDPRKRYTVAEGFPATAKHQKHRMMALVRSLTAMPELCALLGGIRRLPPPAYTGEQWQILRHIFTALRHAVLELNAVFAEAGAVDFVELGIAARRVLEGTAQAGGGPPIRHLLVDEFQDTSRRQHQLIASLLRDWHSGDGRTVFLVGDPMQSIYMFRQADVELFEIVRQRGFTTDGGALPIHTLRLTTNFRSNAGVVEPLNELFGKVFPHASKLNSAGVDFLPGTARDATRPEGAYNIHPTFLVKQPPSKEPAKTADEASRPTERADETAQMLAVIQRHLPRIERARGRNEQFTIAVLGRVRNHLIKIAAALRAEEIPFRAVELEKLGERQEIVDLQSLTRALLHPLDRIAWLSMLRAPWCGLTLRELHLLCGTDERKGHELNVQRQIESNLALLGVDAQERVLRMVSVLGAAARSRNAQASFSSWIGRTWHSLGGPACVDAVGYENALTYFRMLEDVAPDGIAATGEVMADQLDRLFARPDPSTSDRLGVQVMTIHKAKGLGFNIVLVPGLDRRAKQDSPELVCYLERVTGRGPELLAAPLDRKGDGKSAVYGWVRRQKGDRETEERKRLLYVACTRAREELHLFATVPVTSSQADGSASMTARITSLLHTAWPALEEIFQAKYTKQSGVPATAGPGTMIPFPMPAGKPVPGVLDMAAGAESSLRRLPPEWFSGGGKESVTDTVTDDAGDIGDSVRQRPEGSPASRALGTVVHTLFERATELLRNGATPQDLQAALPGLRKQAAALARNEGLPQAEVESTTAAAISALAAAIGDPVGIWILGPRDQARTETSWTGVIGDATRTLRIDRSFRAGDAPLSDGGDTLWVLDYKTASTTDADPGAFLAGQRQLYGDQLAGYGQLMRLIHGSSVKLVLGLYYPLLRRLDFWSM